MVRFILQSLKFENFAQTFSSLFRKQWRAACEDLEAAYKIDPAHKNAKDYLIRVLFDWSSVISAQALSGNESSKPDLKRAATLLEQILDLEPGHVEARSKLQILRFVNLCQSEMKYTSEKTVRLCLDSRPN